MVEGRGPRWLHWVVSSRLPSAHGVVCFGCYWAQKNCRCLACLFCICIIPIILLSSLANRSCHTLCVLHWLVILGKLVGRQVSGQSLLPGQMGFAVCFCRGRNEQA